jgi:hypothetical protein
MIIIIIIIRKYLRTIPGNHAVKELQKTAILVTAHIGLRRKVLMYKYIRAIAGASDMGAIKISDRIAATLYSLGAWFVSGICV